MNIDAKIQEIKDKDGLEYTLEKYYDGEDGLTLYLCRRNRQIGHIYCIIKNGVMDIGDLKIEDDVFHGQRGFFFSILYSILEKFRWKRKTTNYQNRGLGTILLNFSIEKAKSRKLKRVFGFVMPDDIENTPGLLEWYQHRGFLVYQKKMDGGTNPIHHINMVL